MLSPNRIQQPGSGQVLAGAGLLYPVWGKHLELTPDFEHRILEGEVFVKGVIRMVYFVNAGIRLLLNKSVRITIKHVKQFKL